ncbi:geranylgeranyl reductase family protein [Ferrimicrobium sp.]|uniref:geranylgeranyl reductase family protein n=1 Tax=Ferrimicrobium sp. TaxID=2926050 RepID=UPI0026272A0C|nr:geranylgeranyl reductase family protein [Ferrimicrobium sp.]
MRVLVVGAGPAGSLTATLLARGGHTVVLIDRSTFPRDKACGDVIGPLALSVLEQVGVRLPGDAHRIGSMWLGFEGDEMLMPARPGLGHRGYGLTIRRKDFDDILYRMAISEGAESRVGVVGAVERRGSRLRAHLDGVDEEFDVVVGADGANSAVARAMGMVDLDRVLLGFALRRHVSGSTLTDRVDLLLEGREMVTPGYGWVFDQGSDQLNLGIGVGVGAQRARAKGARELLDRYEQDLVDRNIITTVGTHQEMGGWLKMGLVGTRVAAEGVYLVGDAAGLVNPLQGEGIAAALTSASLCATVIDRWGANGDVAYRRAIDQHFRKFLTTGYTIQRVALEHPKATRVAMQSLVRLGRRSERLASGWGIFWNDLTAYSGRQPGARAARLALGLGQGVTNLTPARPSWRD